MKSKNLRRMDPKSFDSFFHFLPLDFFLFLRRNLEFAPFNSFWRSLSPAFCPFYPTCPAPPAPLAPSSISCPFSPAASLLCYNRRETKFLHTLSWSSICLSIYLWVKSSRTSCLFLLTLLITGIKKIKEMNREHEAAISKYKKIDMFDSLLLWLSFMMASVELLSACITEFRQFFNTNSTLG